VRVADVAGAQPADDVDLGGRVVRRAGRAGHSVAVLGLVAERARHRRRPADDARVPRGVVRRTALSRDAGTQLVLIADVAGARPADHAIVDGCIVGRAGRSRARARLVRVALQVDAGATDLAVGLERTIALAAGP